jgi:tRNA (adenine57-N1/adenine58-N1)-methyltransferase
MIGHTAFIVTARRMAPGQRPPLKRRRPAPGAYGPDYTGPRPVDVPVDPVEPDELVDPVGPDDE